jgi:hypothetical protein
MKSATLRLSLGFREMDVTIAQELYLKSKSYFVFGEKIAAM